jgi:hypothetical protein
MVVADMTSYPVMQAASVVLALLLVYLVVYYTARWIVSVWVSVWRQRPPIVRDLDGVWRPARRRNTPR